MTFLFHHSVLIWAFCLSLLSSCLLGPNFSNESSHACLELACEDSTLYHVIGEEFGYQWLSAYGDSVASNYIDFGIAEFQEFELNDVRTVCLQVADTCVQTTLDASNDGYAQQYFQSLERELVHDDGDEQTWKLWPVDDTSSYWLVDIDLSGNVTWPMLRFLEGRPTGIQGKRGDIGFSYLPPTDFKVLSIEQDSCGIDSTGWENVFPPTYFGEDNIQIMGKVIERVSVDEKKPVKNVDIEIFKNDQIADKILIPDSGTYEFFLPLEYKYLIVFSAEGYVHKSVEIDARYMSMEDRSGGFTMEMDLSLFQEIPGVDFSVLDQPIGKCRFDRMSNSMSFDFEYTKVISDSVAVLQDLQTH